MRSFLNAARNWLRRTPLSPLQFPRSGFPVVGDSAILEEEQFNEFQSGLYYPVNIGDVYESKYQVLGKLGFGTTSTVWLARNLREHSFVALKVFRQGAGEKEVEMFKHINNGSTSHPGHNHVRTALSTFILQRDQAQHFCLVQKPMWDSWKDMLRRNPAHKFTSILLKAGLAHLLLGLDYLHTECKVVHTDIKADNILQELIDKSVLEAFVKDELEDPSPRKSVQGATVYLSRTFDLPSKFGNVVLSDFGSAVRGDTKQTHDAQPDVYRSPEVMLMTEWSYPVDIWNVGVMIWDLYEGHHLFYGQDPEKSKYTTRAHLAELVGLLGPPPLDLLRRGTRSMELFGENGEWKAGVSIPQDVSLEKSVTRVEGEEKTKFMTFLRGMLQWRPEDRKTAAQLLDDPWLYS